MQSAPARWIAAAVVYMALATALVWPSIDGDFLSDDHMYIVNNPYVQGLSVENVKAILDPYGAPTIYTLNYAPVHLLLHAAQWEIVENETRLYHLTSSLAHGLVSLLLVPFFVRAGIPILASVLASLVFLVHPANVETVAWIFQIKTILALGMSIGALLLHERRPAVAAALFTLALLTKVTALGVLPVAAAQTWIRSRSAEPVPPRWGWIGVWVIVALAVCVAELPAFQRQGDARIAVHEDVLVHLRTIFAIAARYLWMAVSAANVATLQEPPPATSWLDPWWLTGLVATLALGLRTVRAFLRGEEEACLWLFAAAAFAPVSQIFPFIFPVADHYLYPILPGLLGGGLLALQPLWRRVRPGRAGADGVTMAAVALLLVIFGVRAHDRAAVFSNEESFLRDSAAAYPVGMSASLLRGRQAALDGDAATAAAAYRRAVDLGYSDLGALFRDPTFARVLQTPVFQETVRYLAKTEIDRLSRHEKPEQTELLRLSLAYEVQGDLDAALDAAERAAEADGPFSEAARNRRDLMRRVTARRATP